MSKAKSVVFTPNELLRYAREQRDWTQEDVAEKLTLLVGKGINEPISSKTIHRWERDGVKPSLTYRKALKKLFGIEDLRQLGWAEDDSTIPYWQVKVPLSPFFTGREGILVELHKCLIALPTQNPPMPPALVGLGGVGKTQIALEYARRHMADYQTVILLHATSYDELVTEFATIASLIGLPEAETEKDQQVIIAAVMRWLTHPLITRWLLIFDSADNLDIVRDFIPHTCHGHIIITSQSQATGEIALPIEVDAMDANEGAYLLLKRARIVKPGTNLEDVPEADFQAAQRVSALLEGLPLALDQAGAYIEETDSSLSGYPEQYQTQTQLLLQRRGANVKSHEVPVVTTWSLAFEKISATSPAAVELLYLFSYLAPHGIPEEIVLEGTPVLGSLLQPLIGNSVAFNFAMGELRRYSLVRRDNTAKTCSLHSLVQTVIKNSLDLEIQRQWAERVVKSVDNIFPDVKAEISSRHERYLPHALVATELIEKWDIACLEAARLLDQTGLYLWVLARYHNAELLCLRAVTLYEKLLGFYHLQVAASLTNVVEICYEQAKYDDAEVFCKKALAIREHLLSGDHPEIAASLNDLAAIYHVRAMYSPAEKLYQKALDMRKRIFGDMHSDVALSLNTLASLYQDQNKYPQAEDLYLQARKIYEQLATPSLNDVKTNLNNLASLYYRLQRYEEVEVLLQQALAIDTQIFGPDHPELATNFHNFGNLYSKLRKYDVAESYYQRALEIYMQAYGPKHPYVAGTFYGLGELYADQEKPTEAESFLRKALTIREQMLGMEHPSVAPVLDSLARLLTKKGQWIEAQELEKRAESIRAKYTS